MSEKVPVPTEIRLNRAERILHLSFADGSGFDLPVEYLRVNSPSAEVQGHGPGQRKLVAGKSMVSIDKIEPRGHYAVSLYFDDGHDSGIFSWEVLYRLGSRYHELWPAYLAELERAGLSRDPHGNG